MKLKERLAIAYAKKNLLNTSDVKEFGYVAPFIMSHQDILTFIMDKSNAIEDRRERFLKILPEVHAYTEKHPKAAPFFIDWENKGREKLEVHQDVA